MKTSVFKFTCSIFATLFLMSSCLGDSDGYYENSRDFVYINSDIYGKYAATSAGEITHPVIDNLSVGQCYYMKYKIKSSKNTTTQRYQAESVELLDNEPVDQGEFHYKSVPYSGMTVEQRNDSIILSSLSVQGGYPSNYIGDRWLFNYNASLKATDEVEAHFYYDDKNQKDATGNALEANQIIVDVRFIKYYSEAGGAAASNQSRSVVGNLSDIRSKYSPTYGSDGIADVVLKFRFQKSQGSDKPAIEELLGSWNINGGGNVYFMRFEK